MNKSMRGRFNLPFTCLSGKLTISFNAVRHATGHPRDVTGDRRDPWHATGHPREASGYR